MSKKKILYIHHGKGLGGAPLSLLYLIQNLDITKYHPVVLFLQDSEVIDLYKSKGIEVFGPLNILDFPHTKIWWYKWYHFPYFFKSCLHTFKTINKIANYWLDKIKPDLVHLNTSSLIAWGKVANKKGIPVVWHIREPLADGYFGLRKKIIQKFVEKYSTVIVPICKNDAKPWQNNSKVNVVYNAVDSKVFNKDVRILRQAQDERTGFYIKDLCENYSSPFVVSLSNHTNDKAASKILFLGGLSKEKGALEIFEIFKRLLKDLPDATLLVAGYFDKSLKSFLNSKRYFPSEQYKIKVLKVLKEIEKSVVFLGPIKNVAQVMAESDVIVFPATVGHFARPIIEAGFMGKPVVASDLPPLNELVVVGKTGFLIDIKKQNLWVEKLKILLLNEKLRKQMGQDAFEFCLKNFDVKDQVVKIDKIYLSLSENHGFSGQDE